MTTSVIVLANCTEDKEVIVTCVDRWTNEFGKPMTVVTELTRLQNGQHHQNYATDTRVINITEAPKGSTISTLEIPQVQKSEPEKPVDPTGRARETAEMAQRSTFTKNLEREQASLGMPHPRTVLSMNEAKAKIQEAKAELEKVDAPRGGRLFLETVNENTDMGDAS